MNTKALKSRPFHLMGSRRRDSMAGLTGACFLLLFSSFTQSLVFAEQRQVDAHLKRQPAGSLLFRRAGRAERASAAALVTGPVGNLAEDSSLHHSDPAAAAASSSASSSQATSSAKKKPLIKFRPSLMVRGAVPLTDATYFDFIKANPVVLVIFYAPWCSWSRRALPEFDSAARVLAQEQLGEDAVLLAKVDCTQNEEVMLHEAIEEFPTIKLFAQARPKVYDGGRQRADILRWVQLNLNQGRTVGSIDSLKEILASRALGTLVVIAAWPLESNTGTDGPEQHATTSGPEVDNVRKTEGPLLSSPSQKQKALRSSASQDAEKRIAIVTSSLSDSTNSSGNSVAALIKAVPSRRHLSAAPPEKVIDSTIVNTSRQPPADAAIQKSAFSHVARLAGSNVIFGEASTPQVLRFLMDKYIRPHLHEKVSARLQLPLIAAFPAKVRGVPGESQSLVSNEEIRLYNGRLDDWNQMADFVRASKFPPAVPFTDIWAPKIFDDGRPVCILFVDPKSNEKYATEEEGQATLHKKAFLKVAPEFRMKFIFTVAGYSAPHEKRLMTLLGLEDGESSPQLRIATFSSQGNDSYFPMLKYRPTLQRSGTYALGKGNSGEEGQKTPVNLSRTGAYGLRTASGAQELRKEVRTGAGENDVEKEGNDQDRVVPYEQELRRFLTSYLEGSLEPYLRSEPVPSEEENQNDLKIVVGSTFEQLVRQSEEDVLVEFGAPWCGHCRKLEPMLKLLAAALREAESTVVLAKIDATRNEVKGLYFVAYPTLVLFPSMRKESPLIYEGDRTEQKLLEWLSENVRGDRINVKQVLKIIEEKKKRKTSTDSSFQLLQKHDRLYRPPLHGSVLEEL